MNKTTYRPLGTRVLLKILPIEKTSDILLPDGASNPNVRQTFRVEAVGGHVNDAQFSLKEGEIVMIACHNSEILPLSKEEQTILVDRSKVILVVEETQMQN